MSPVPALTLVSVSGYPSPLLDITSELYLIYVRSQLCPLDCYRSKPYCSKFTSWYLSWLSPWSWLGWTWGSWPSGALVKISWLLGSMPLGVQHYLLLRGTICLLQWVLILFSGLIWSDPSFNIQVHPLPGSSSVVPNPQIQLPGLNCPVVCSSTMTSIWTAVLRYGLSCVSFIV